MRIYSEAEAFNDLFQVGDMLLVRDPFGDTFMGRLTRRAIVMGEEAYIELENWNHPVNIGSVVEKVVTTAPVSTSSMHREWLSRLLHKRVDRYKARIKAYRETITQLNQLRQKARATLAKDSILIDYYESAIKRYESILVNLQVAYHTAVTRLNELTRDS